MLIYRESQKPAQVQVQFPGAPLLQANQAFTPGKEDLSQGKLQPEKISLPQPTQDQTAKRQAAPASASFSTPAPALIAQQQQVDQFEESTENLQYTDNGESSDHDEDMEQSEEEATGAGAGAEAGEEGTFASSSKEQDVEMLGDSASAKAKAPENIESEVSVNPPVIQFEGSVNFKDKKAKEEEKRQKKWAQEQRLRATNKRINRHQQTALELLHANTNTNRTGDDSMQSQFKTIHDFVADPTIDYLAMRLSLTLGLHQQIKDPDLFRDTIALLHVGQC